MKKLLLLSVVLLVAVSASQAGVHLDIGLPLPRLPLPPLPGITIGRPAPRAYYDAPGYYAPPVYEAPPPVYYDSPVVIAPPPLYFGFGSRSYGYHGYDGHHYTYRGGRDYHRGGHYDGHHRR
jgi:hypothetical protein